MLQSLIPEDILRKMLTTAEWSEDEIENITEHQIKLIEEAISDSLSRHNAQNQERLQNGLTILQKANMMYSQVDESETLTPEEKLVYVQMIEREMHKALIEAVGEEAYKYAMNVES